MWIALTYNSLVSKDQAVQSSWSDITVEYQRRIDLIPQVMAAVNVSMGFEQSLLTNITNLRTEWLSSLVNSTQENINITSQLDAELNEFLLVATGETYPDVQSIEVVQDFITVMEGTENRIAAHRIFYNDAVEGYNTAVNSFPGNIVAGMFGFEDAAYYQQGT